MEVQTVLATTSLEFAFYKEVKILVPQKHCVRQDLVPHVMEDFERLRHNRPRKKEDGRFCGSSNSPCYNILEISILC